MQSTQFGNCSIGSLLAFYCNVCSKHFHSFWRLTPSKVLAQYKLWTIWACAVFAFGVANSIGVTQKLKISQFILSSNVACVGCSHDVNIMASRNLHNFIVSIRSFVWFHLNGIWSRRASARLTMCIFNWHFWPHCKAPTMIRSTGFVHVIIVLCGRLHVRASHSWMLLFRSLEFAFVAFVPSEQCERNEKYHFKISRMINKCAGSCWGALALARWHL